MDFAKAFNSIRKLSEGSSPALYLYKTVFLMDVCISLHAAP